MQEKPLKKQRNLKQEYQISKKYSKTFTINVSPQLFEDFTAKVSLSNTNKNALIKQWITNYTYGDCDDSDK